MHQSFRHQDGKLAPCPAEQALWIDLCQPGAGEIADIAPFVPEVPTPEDMAEIEISARLYRETGHEVMTVLVPGIDRQDNVTPIIGPVAFLLSKERLVTVRYHAMRPFETYPPHAQQMALGCARPEQIFLGLVEEIVGRIADLLEGAGRALDQVARRAFSGKPGGPDRSLLQDSLESSGRQAEMVAHCSLSLLSLERALSFFQVSMSDRGQMAMLGAAIAGLARDIQSLEVHADHLSNRISQATDATLGMINLAQNTTVRIVSVVAVLFLPPTLIASIYGMNFRVMPELAPSWGYPAALGLMVASALITWAVFKWKKWL